MNELPGKYCKCPEQPCSVPGCIWNPSDDVINREDINKVHTIFQNAIKVLTELDKQLYEI